MLALLCIFLCSSPLTYALTLSSSDFFNQDALPASHTCDGKDQSPELNWEDAPAKTVSYTLIMSDLDAPLGIFYHWVVFNIPANISSLPAGIVALPAGALLGKNSWGTSVYKGPCPPKDANHRYVFSLYALNTMLTLPAESMAGSILDAMQDHILGESDLKVTYGH